MEPINENGEMDFVYKDEREYTKKEKAYLDLFTSESQSYYRTLYVEFRESDFEYGPDFVNYYLSTGRISQQVADMILNFEEIEEEMFENDIAILSSAFTNIYIIALNEYKNTESEPMLTEEEIEYLLREHRTEDGEL